MPKYLITGGAGFIGSHLVDRLSLTEAELVVIDNFDAYYSRDEKLANINPHVLSGRVVLLEADILDDRAFDSICLKGFDGIVHLAALAGVRPSLARPLAYQQVNVVGTTRLLELAKQWSIPRFIFASSSSVYGNHPAVPWTESLQYLLPISPYAASKLSAELIGHTYSHLYGITFVALRLFTVYGPRQRPDLATHTTAIASDTSPCQPDRTSRLGTCKEVALYTPLSPPVKLGNILAETRGRPGPPPPQ